MTRIFLTALLQTLTLQIINAQDAIIQVSINKDQVNVSPNIYGKNNSFSNVFGSPTSSEQITLYKEAGLRFVRENGGNNSTKYNWRKKISSHPDWYNNVYDHDWDFAAQTIQENIPDMQAMFGFQLIGKVAANKNNNFDDWGYNNSQWWDGVAQNLAGGGQVNPAGGGNALVEGNPDLYLMDWNADSTTAILNHWFGIGALGLNKERFVYWSMDNEPEIWEGTHDDVIPDQISASEFMNLYLEVAKKARERFPEIKLCGPVVANEWQWYKWSDENLYINDTYYCWLEYFIKRVADEQKTSGIRLLDMIDIHWYPGESSGAQVVQHHRVFFDESYAYPGANGVKTINGGWSGSINKEYIFKRINDWLNKHFGENHGITLGLSEFGSNTSDPNINSVMYASMLGTFANYGVDVFTPWSWKKGMWETLHLFSCYAKNICVKTTSTLENTVSGYSTVNDSADSVTIILVNRDLSASKSVVVNLEDFSVSDGYYTTLELSSLPSYETFKSHTSNALKSGYVKLAGNSFSTELPPLSTTAVLLTKNGSINAIDKIQQEYSNMLNVYPNPANKRINISLNAEICGECKIEIFDQSGKLMQTIKWQHSQNNTLVVDIEKFMAGVYLIKVQNNSFTVVKKFIISK